MGSLVFPQMMEGLLAKLILWPLGGGDDPRLYPHGYGRASVDCTRYSGEFRSLMLLIWHYEPNQRFVLPLAPLLLAGFCFEMVASARSVSRRNRPPQSQPASGGLWLCGVVASRFCTVGLVLQISMVVGVVPNLSRDDRANTMAYRSMYGWIAEPPAGRRQYPVAGRYGALPGHRTATPPVLWFLPANLKPPAEMREKRRAIGESPNTPASSTWTTFYWRKSACATMMKFSVTPQPTRAWSLFTKKPAEFFTGFAKGQTRSADFASCKYLTVYAFAGDGLSRTNGGNSGGKHVEIRTLKTN